MKRGRILRIRPFNMANFSGGSGILIWAYWFDMITVIPYYWIITAGTIIKHGEFTGGEYDKETAVKRLNRRVLPAMLIAAVVWTALLMVFRLGYSGLWECLPSYLICGFMPCLVSYCSLRLILAGKQTYRINALYFEGLLFVIAGALLFYSLYMKYEKTI